MPCAGCEMFFEKTRLKRCNRCKLIEYCSRDCQVKNWRFHKANCKDMDAFMAQMKAMGFEGLGTGPRSR